MTGPRTASSQRAASSRRSAPGSSSEATSTSMTVSRARTVRARLTIVDVEVASLELPGADRRELAARCELAVRGPVTERFRHQPALTA